jgi:hypothetical protein
MGIDEPERMLDDCRENRDMLESLLQELGRRRVSRAKKLRARVTAATAKLNAARLPPLTLRS